MRALPFLVLSLLAAPARSAQSPAGYVVKAETGSVYLDLGEGSGASAGQAFEVFVEGEELRHPVTKEPLGKVETKLARGVIREVLPKYSVGTLEPSAAPIKPGMRARLSSPAPAAGPVPGDPSMTGAGRQPRWKSPPLDFQVSAMAIGDLRGDGKPVLALADEKTVRVYEYPPSDTKPLAVYVRPGTGPKILGLEAGDMDGDGRQELFVSLYNDTMERVETAALQLAGGELKVAVEFPWLTRGYRDAKGQRRLAVQQLSDDNTFPFSGIYPLHCEAGRCGKGKESLGLKRVEWLFDFTLADLGGEEPAVVALTKTNRLRLDFGKKSWRGKDAFGQTPMRLRWPRANGRLLEFHPPIEVGYGPDKAVSLYLLRNQSALGSLSAPFGFFNAGEVQRQSWDGVTLKVEWKAELGGYSPALALVGEPGSPKELAVAVVGAAEKSAIWVYDP